ncbi:MAG: glutamate-5-semialdehyde dehydrogenase [Bacteroidota bacterium]
MTHISTSTLADNIQYHLIQVDEASRSLAQCTAAQISAVLNDLAELTIARQTYLLQANQKDLDRMNEADPLYDRLLLNEDRLENIASDLRKVAAMPSPLGKILEERKLPNKLHIRRISVPLGIIGIVYESRPNVTFDVFSLCFKSGNAAVLKGSRHAHFSNIAIVELIHKVLEKHNLPTAICYLMPSERAALKVILEAVSLIDIIIPRGGRGLIDFVRDNAKVPVIETGAGIVHAYIDKSADVEKAKAIVTNAKSRRVSVCNALDTILIHEERLEDLYDIVENLGKTHQCEIFADESAHTILESKYPSILLHQAQAEDFGTEFLSMKLSIKMVRSADAAIAHIAQYSSKHSEAIIAEDDDTIAQFLNQVDAAVVYANASTAFTDGAQFGLGTEIGISTQKLHARGPMALRELTSYKWIVEGDGQVRN